MRRLQFFSLVFCFLAVSLPAETWYLIAGTELARLETISTNWQTNRQNLASTLKSSQETVEHLKLNSENLAASLKQETETRQSLQQSFDKYADDQRTKLSNAENRANLETEKASKSEARFWKVVAALVALAALDVLYIVFRIKKIVPF